MTSTATTTATVEDVEMGEGYTTTEKGARSLATSGSARVDLFFKTARGINSEQLKKLLDSAWAEDKLDTLKIIFHARDCRGGKGERQIFRDAISWVIENCEKNFLINLDLCVELGRWEDLLWFLGGKSQTVTEAIANKFAKQLKQDVEDMKAKKSISLAAKWAPTENCKHDKKNHAAKYICTALGVNYKTYRKEYLSPLRNYIKVVERLMCDKKWNEIEYSKVPGVAMNKLKKAFAKNDKERFEEWKAKLVKGEAKVNATTVEPHELCRQYFRSNQKDDVIEEQWKVIVERVKQLGSLSDSIVLSDVSGSMSGTPMEVSVALGILISSLTAEPFKGQIITFESNPHFHSVNGSTLFEQVKDVLSMSWGGSTNFIAAFDRILEKAQQFGLSPEQMPKRLYVISDMQFDSACEGNWMTNYQTIQVKYQQAGYPVPEIVFWNVNGRTNDVATKADQQGVALISGFSPSILKSVLTGKTITPYEVLRNAIDDKRYSGVKLAE